MPKPRSFQNGYDLKPSSYMLEKAAIFTQAGIDLKCVADLASKKYTEEFNSSIRFKNTILSTSYENSKKAAAVGIYGDEIFAEALNDLYPELQYDVQGKFDVDVVCHKIPLMSMEIKCTLDDKGIYLSKTYGRYCLRPLSYYSPAINTTNGKLKTIQDETLILHTKFNLPKTKDDVFKVIFVQLLCIDRDSIKPSTRNGYLTKDILESRSIMLYEDVNHIKEVWNKMDELNKNLKN